nr:3-deoxy-D-manno-octulosonic acid transferase [Opitutaceae bacterium]
ELARLLALGELVFVGKTLPPHTEGQTPVEAAARGRAVVFGPGTANFRVIARELEQAGAAVRVADAADLARSVRELAGDVARRERQGAAGRAWHAGNRGAARRTREALEKILRGEN